MNKLATDDEIKKAIPFLSLRWEKQNDKQDHSTEFIYFCQRIDQVIDLAFSNNIDVSYAIHRWFNYQTSKKVEDIFCRFGAEHYPDERNHDIDIMLYGVPIDIKLSIISQKYKGNKNLTTRQNKDNYLKWLLSHSSTESRTHTKNKVFVVVDNLVDKCKTDIISKCVKNFVAYFVDNISRYDKNNICELVYVKV